MATVRLLFADPEGRLYDHPELLAAAASGEDSMGAPAEAPSPMPAHATLMGLPGRRPVGVDPASGETVLLDSVKVGRRRFVPDAVAATLPPGWTRTLLPAYRRTGVAPQLPQWAYTAAGWERGRAVVWALHTDRRAHWDPARHSTGDLPALVAARLAEDPDNRLLRQIAKCALEYRCFTAQNTFYRRDEGAIAASVGCNARCVGCISWQPEGAASPPSHERPRGGPPSAEEMAAVGGPHLAGAPGRTMISFGQGCEGEPLTRAGEIARSIRLMRARTARGSLNINTNGSLPEGLGLLLQEGLDAVRVSLNSAAPDLYAAYYGPVGYAYADVEKGIAEARRAGAYVSLNLLTFPGVTDRAGEVDLLADLVARHRVDQVQTRPLAMDPEQYLAVARGRGAGGPPIGVENLMRRLKRARPGLVIGNFARGMDER